MNYPDSLADCRIGFIGVGKAAEDLATGFIKSGTIRAEQMSASAPSDRKLTKFKELDCRTTNDSNKIFSHLSETEDKNCFKIIFVYMKPKLFSSLMIMNTHYKTGDKYKILDTEKLMVNSGPILFISLIPGSTIWEIQSQIFIHKTPEEVKQKIRFVRLMTNTATAICEGICALSLKDYSKERHQPLRNFLTKLFRPIGLCEFAENDEFKGISILAESGLAFVYEMIQALSDGGVKIGIPRAVSTKIAAQTVLGAALMVQKTEKNPIVLRDEVTEPRSATAQALHALENRSFSGVVIDAIECANKTLRESNRKEQGPEISSDEEWIVL